MIWWYGGMMIWWYNDIMIWWYRIRFSAVWVCLTFQTMLQSGHRHIEWHFGFEILMICFELQLPVTPKKPSPPTSHPSGRGGDGSGCPFCYIFPLVLTNLGKFGRPADMRPSAPLEELQILLRGPLSLYILAEVDQFLKFSGVGPALRPRSPFRVFFLRCGLINDEQWCT